MKMGLFKTKQTIEPDAVPLKMMRPCSSMVRFIRSCTISASASLPSRASISSAYSRSDSATEVLIIVFVSEMELDAPSMRNSNLLPVNANGEVRLRSVVSFGSFGST